MKLARYNTQMTKRGHFFLLFTVLIQLYLQAETSQNEEKRVKNTLVHY